jgi:hypothetical protein
VDTFLFANVETDGQLSERGQRGFVVAELEQCMISRKAFRANLGLESAVCTPRFLPSLIRHRPFRDDSVNYPFNLVIQIK